MKPQEDDIREYLYYLKVGNYFLNRTQNLVTQRKALISWTKLSWTS